MRHNFCTVVDAAYLPRLLVLHRSLVEHCPDFSLWVYCVDEVSDRLLRGLALERVVVGSVRNLEDDDEELRAVKPTRTAVEYCWTAKASACLHLLRSEPRLEAITYIDADLGFFADPQPLFAEMGRDSVMIVPHRFAAAYRDFERSSGIYNAGWVTFRNDRLGRDVVEWWRARCLEWCHARYEDGKMSDQKYLEQWPDRFEGVHVLAHPGGGLAPWNVPRYRLEEGDGQPTVDGQELVFYHYHSLRLFEPRPLPRLASRLSGTPRRGPLLWTTAYPASPLEERLIWAPYIRRLHDEWSRIHSLGPELAGGVARWSVRNEMAPRRLLQLASLRVRRRLNIVSDGCRAQRCYQEAGRVGMFVRDAAEQLFRAELRLLAMSASDAELIRLGSSYGGWWVPEGALVPGAVAYCGGAGEDISFDAALAARGLRVRTFDPTPRAIAFVESRHIAGDFRFLRIGWWDQETQLRFYAPRDPTHVSHSALNLQSTSDYFDASVDTVEALARELGDDRIDILKMDIEGAEHRVIRSLLRSMLRPAVLCVEFDQRRGVAASLLRLRRAGYRVAKVERWNVTFVRR